MTRVPTKDTFARRLREERSRVGMSQTALAAHIAELTSHSIDGTAVTRIEQSRRAVRLDEAVAAAAALEVPLMALVTEESDVEARLRVLRSKVDQQESRARTAEWEIQQAQSTIADLNREIEQLEASRGD